MAEHVPGIHKHKAGHRNKGAMHFERRGKQVENCLGGNTMSPRQPSQRKILLARTLKALGVPVCLFDSSVLPSQSIRSMGTVATITLGTAKADYIETISNQVREIFNRLEEEMTVYRWDSAISEVSRMAGVAPVRLPEDTYRVLELAQRVANLSAGALDTTAAPLTSTWGFNGAAVPVAVPSDQSIRDICALVGYRRLVLHDRSAFLTTKGMALDLGGIAKGYAVDRAWDYCLRAGIQDFLIDFSGNIRAAGCPWPGERWQIGVRDPFDRTSIIGKINLPSGMALATSGSYEQFVDIAGGRFSHIVDPRTGYPAAATASVTALCPDAVTADAFSTAFFVLGLEAAPQLLQKVPGTELLIIPDRHPPELWLTPEFRRVFTPVPQLANTVKILYTRS